ncbi:hypothetical protein ABK040_001566 [Willaertia magna]
MFLYSFGLGRNRQLFGRERKESNAPAFTDLSFLKPKETIAKIACGSHHSIMLTSENRLLSCGFNCDGRCGAKRAPRIELHEIEIRNKPIKDVFCGAKSSFVITNCGNLFCCGSNRSGQLGFPKTTIPMLEELKHNTTVLNVELISSSYFHTLLLTKDHVVYGTGSDEFGRLGFFDYETFDKFTVLNFNDLEKEEKMIDIKCGEIFSVFLSNFGNIFAAGEFFNIQLGIKKFPLLHHSVSKISCGNAHVLCLTKENRLLSFGLNSSCQLGVCFVPKEKTELIEIPLNNIVNIYGGLNHSIVIDKDNNLYGFGNNSCNELGIELAGPFTEPTRLCFFEPFRYQHVELFMGLNHSFLLLKEFKTKEFEMWFKNLKSLLQKSELCDLNIVIKK